MNLSRFDIAAINEARAVLQRIEDEAREEAWNKPSSIQWDAEGGFQETVYAHSYGMLIANAENASTALFNLLLTCKHNMHMDITEDDLHNRDAENEGDGREPDGQRIEGGRIVPTDR